MFPREHFLGHLLRAYPAVVHACAAVLWFGLFRADLLQLMGSDAIDLNMAAADLAAFTPDTVVECT